MPAVKSSKKDTSAIGLLKDRINALDPMQASVMILGGTAAACGIVPPMTQMLSLMNGKSGVDNWQLAGSISPPAAVISTFLKDMFDPNTQTSLSPTEETLKILGLFASGAVEACVMYALVTNPETFKALIALPGQAMEGAGKILPLL